MRALTTEEQALYDLRFVAMRQWAHDCHRDILSTHLWDFAPVDKQAERTLRRQHLLYKAVLVEPPGDVNPHHLINDTVWDYFRQEMQLPPSVFYARATSAWETLFAGSNWRNDWHRAVIDGNTVIPRLVRDTGQPDEVPGSYTAVTDKQVLEFLSISGGRIIPLDEIADPYPPLEFAAFAKSGQIGTFLNFGGLSATGGKPPYTYSVASNPSNLRTVQLPGTGQNAGVILTGVTAGAHKIVLRVTDARGLTDDATVSLTVTPEAP